MVFNYYQIANVKNKKRYIGITAKEIEKRFKEHITALESNKHHNYILQKDWNIFGKENFIFSLIEQRNYENVEDGYEREFELISQSTNLYNLSPGGMVNPMYSKIVKEKMTQSKQQVVPNIYQLLEIEENKFKIINKFNSQKEAQKITGLSQANISKSIREKVKGSGYYWVTEEQLYNFSEIWRPKRTKFTPTAQLDNNDKIIKVHHNRSLFEKDYGWKTGTITAAIRRDGKAFGIKFKNIGEDEYYTILPITLIF